MVILLLNYESKGAYVEIHERPFFYHMAMRQAGGPTK